MLANAYEILLSLTTLWSPACQTGYSYQRKSAAEESKSSIFAPKSGYDCISQCKDKSGSKDIKPA